MTVPLSGQIDGSIGTGTAAGPSITTGTPHPHAIGTFSTYDNSLSLFNEPSERPKASGKGTNNSITFAAGGTGFPGAGK